MKNEHDLTVAGLAGILHCDYTGAGDTVITGCAGLENGGPGDLVFVSQSKYMSELQHSLAAAAIIPQDEDSPRMPAIKAPDPHLAFVKIIEQFFPPVLPQPGLHPQAQIAPSAKIGTDVSIGALAVIQDNAVIESGTIIFPMTTIYPDVFIGRDCIIHTHVSIREGTRLGNNVIVHNGAKIGSDGFGYLPARNTQPRKIPQLGMVLIEDEVEIGANTTIDRAALEATVIRRGTKIDNLVQIAHNVVIGENCILMGQVGIGGSSSLGNNVVVGGQVGIADHVNIGDNVVIAAKSGVTNDIPAGSIIAGYPHLNIREWRKTWAALPQLPGLIKEVRKLKKLLAEDIDK